MPDGAAPAAQHIDNIDLCLRQPRKIIGPEFSPVILVKALLRHVRADEIGEFGLFQAQPFAFFCEARAETHLF